MGDLVAYGLSFHHTSKSYALTYGLAVPHFQSAGRIVGGTCAVLLPPANIVNYVYGTQSIGPIGICNI